MSEIDPKEFKRLQNFEAAQRPKNQAMLKAIEAGRLAVERTAENVGTVRRILTADEPPPVEEPEEPGPVDPPDEEPGPPDDDTDPEPVPPDEPVEPLPGRPALYSMKGHLSGLIVPIGIAFNGGDGGYHKAFGLPSDVHASWCRPKTAASNSPAVLGGDLFFKAPWWTTAPRGTGRVLMYRMVPADSKSQKDIFAKAARGDFDDMWRSFAKAAESNGRAHGCPWVEVRMLWEANGGWYAHTVWPEQLADARVAMVRCAHVMRAAAPSLKFSVGFASPGRQPYKNTDMVPRPVEKVPNWNGRTAELPRLHETISLSWYNKAGAQSSSTPAGRDLASWERKIAETRNGAPAQLGSWAEWCLKNNLNIGVAESGNWGDDLPYYVDGMISWIKKYERIINYVCLLGSGDHRMFGGGAPCAKTGQRWLSEVPRRLRVGA